ncbi:MAG: MAPEG family protein, partial [Pseudomonadota bacterium]
GVSSILVHILAFLLVIGRILHPLGIKTVESPGIYRIFGMVLTFFVIGIAAIANIFIYIF